MNLSERMKHTCEDESPWTLTHGLVLNWAIEVAQLEAENAALKRENEALRHGRDRWHRRWGIAFDILDTTQRRQYDEEENQE